jgi:hypothetical protein
MSKKEVLTPAEIAEVHGAVGEIGPRYLALTGDNTKSGNSEMSSVYLSLTANSTKSTN